MVLSADSHLKYWTEKSGFLYILTGAEVECNVADGQSVVKIRSNPMHLIGSGFSLPYVPGHVTCIQQLHNTKINFVVITCFEVS